MKEKQARPVRGTEKSLPRTPAPSEGVCLKEGSTVERERRGAGSGEGREGTLSEGWGIRDEERGGTEPGRTPLTPLSGVKDY